MTTTPQFAPVLTIAAIPAAMPTILSAVSIDVKGG